MPIIAILSRAHPFKVKRSMKVHSVQRLYLRGRTKNIDYKVGKRYCIHDALRIRFMYAHVLGPDFQINTDISSSTLLFSFRPNTKNR